MNGYCFGCGKKLPRREAGSYIYKCSCGVEFRIHVMAWTFYPKDTTDDSDKDHEDTGTAGDPRKSINVSHCKDSCERLEQLQRTVGHMIVNGNMILSHIKSMLQVSDPELIDTLPRKIEEDPKNARIRS